MLIISSLLYGSRVSIGLNEYLDPTSQWDDYMGTFLIGWASQIVFQMLKK